MLASYVQHDPFVGLVLPERDPLNDRCLTLEEMSNVMETKLSSPGYPAEFAGCPTEGEAPFCRRGRDQQDAMKCLNSLSRFGMRRARVRLRAARLLRQSSRALDGNRRSCGSPVARSIPSQVVDTIPSSWIV